MYTTKTFTSQLNNTLLPRMLVWLRLPLPLLKIRQESFHKEVLFSVCKLIHCRNRDHRDRYHSAWDFAAIMSNRELSQVHLRRQACYKCNNNTFR